LDDLTEKSQAMERDLHKAIDDIDEDEQLQWVSKKIQFYLSEDVSEEIMKENLTGLRNEYVKLKNKREGSIKGKKKGRSWWAFLGY
jgi:hypothetical protein